MATMNPLLARLSTAQIAGINDEIGNAVANGRGGLMSNEQMGQLSIPAQGMVNHTFGGNFGGLPEVPQMTPLDEEKALTLAIDTHDNGPGMLPGHLFNGAVARQNTHGDAYFLDPVVRGPVDPARQRFADAGLQKQGFVKTPAGWMPSGGRASLTPAQQAQSRGAAVKSRGDFVPGLGVAPEHPLPVPSGSSAVGWESEAGQSADGGIFSVPDKLPNRQAAQGGGQQMLPPAGNPDAAFYGKYQKRMGIAPEANRRANVTLNAQDRGDQRHVRMGNMSPQDAMLNSLDHRGMANSATGAGMMFGPGAYEANLRVAENARQHDSDAQFARSKQAFAMRYAMEHEGATPQDVEDAWNAATGGVGVNHRALVSIASNSNSQADYYNNVKRAFPGVTQQQADQAWVQSGKSMERGGMLSGVPSFNQDVPTTPGPFDRPRMLGGGAPMKSLGQILGDAASGVGSRLMGF